MAASVWMSPDRSSLPPESDRSLAETMPSVTVGPPARARALPMATTSSPTWRAAESPSCTVGRPLTPWILISATSSAASVPIRVASRACDSPKTVTLIDEAPSITWLLVSTSPSDVRIMPLPALVTWPLLPNPLPETYDEVWIETTPGSTLERIPWMSWGLATLLVLLANVVTVPPPERLSRAAVTPAPTLAPTTAATTAT